MRTKEKMYMCICMYVCVCARVCGCNLKEGPVNDEDEGKDVHA